MSSITSTSDEKGEDMTPDGHYIFAVDFDGTLIIGNTWPEFDGEMNRQLIDYLIREQKDYGSKIILNSNRTGKALDDAVELLGTYGLKFDAINENLPEIIEAYGTDSRKISADRYIDDKAVNPNFFDFMRLNLYGKRIVRKEGEQ